MPMKSLFPKRYDVLECADSYECLLQRTIAEGIVKEEDVKDFVGEY